MTTTGYILLWLLIAAFPVFMVYQLWAKRCPRCGYWSLSFPHSGFLNLGHDEDGVNTLKCKKYEFLKRRILVAEHWQGTISEEEKAFNQAHRPNRSKRDDGPIQ